MSASVSIAQAVPADPSPRTLAQIKDDVLRLDDESYGAFLDWAWHLMGAPGEDGPTEEERQQIFEDAEADRAAGVPTKSWDQLREEMRRWDTK